MIHGQDRDTTQTLVWRFLTLYQHKTMITHQVNVFLHLLILSKIPNWMQHPWHIILTIFIQNDLSCSYWSNTIAQNIQWGAHVQAPCMNWIESQFITQHDSYYCDEIWEVWAWEVSGHSTHWRSRELTTLGWGCAKLPSFINVHYYRSLMTMKLYLCKSRAKGKVWVNISSNTSKYRWIS